MSAGEGTAPHAPAGPADIVLRGGPDPEEIAALVAVLALWLDDGDDPAQPTGPDRGARPWRPIAADFHAPSWRRAS
ncbi:acyl-CoA carboxylase epsilon subunit [Spirillospora sp. CA-253888]